MMPRSLVDLAFLVGALAAGTAIAGAAGAANFGTALTFGELGFLGALALVLMRN